MSPDKIQSPMTTANDPSTPMSIKASPAPAASLPSPEAINYYANTMSPAGTELPSVSNTDNIAAEAPKKPSAMRQTWDRIKNWVGVHNPFAAYHPPHPADVHKKGSKVTETKEVDSPNHIDARLSTISEEIDEILKKQNINFEELQRKVYQVIMLLMRRAAKTDQEFINEMSVNIKAKAASIQGTYNTWPSLTITVISAGVSVFGGYAGLSPLLPAFPGNSAETAAKLAGASQAIGTAGTGISGIGSVFSSKSEAQRGTLQHSQRRDESKEEDRKGSKRNNSESGKSAKQMIDEHNRSVHETASSMTRG